MTNPNNCSICDYKNMVCEDKPLEVGWCYMFKDEPSEICYRHTMRTNTTSLMSLRRILRLIDTLSTGDCR